MRQVFILAAICLFVSCDYHQKEVVDPVDSANIALKKLFPSDTLEALFLVNDERQLKEFFGKKNVTTDTVWGAEGGYYLGTKLYFNTPDEVIINWKDTAKHAGVASVMQSCTYDENTEHYNLKTRWHTRLGVHLGTSLTELVDLNGNDFIFYGMGWDYGGDITDWQSGNFSNKKIFVKLGIDELTEDMEKQYLKVMGDKEYSSRNPAAIKLDPMVVEIVLSGK
jgi:hypothetical protein